MYKFDKKKVFPLNGYCTFSEFDESSIMYIHLLEWLRNMTHVQGTVRKQYSVDPG